ncbi:hypothetical protein J6590_026073 [Homalodisca vitripennis]|nr:hypothetical protein J6590_026073 [Homalodisca vitripennis]
MTTPAVVLIVAGLVFVTGDVLKICEDVKKADEIICEKIHHPTITNREKVFSDIKYYITTLPPLLEALKADKDRTIEVCKDVLQLGTSRFMNIHYDYDHLMRGFNWTDDDMNMYRDLRDNTLTEWVKMEPFIFN